MDLVRAAGLFDGWDEALIWSCLDGHMGNMVLDDDKNPTAAMIDIGDFCFLAGKPTAAVLSAIDGNKLLVPRDCAWASFLEDFYGMRINKMLRYAIKKNRMYLM